LAAGVGVSNLVREPQSHVNKAGVG